MTATMSGVHHILVVAPRDQKSGGDIGHTARRLAQSLGKNDAFVFDGLGDAPGCLTDHLQCWRNLPQAVAETGCVWLHDARNARSIAAYVLARHYRKPVVITRHSDSIPEGSLLQKIWFMTIDRLITRKILCAADQVVFSSDAVAETYYNHVPFTKTVQIIPNGVDVSVFHPVPAFERSGLRTRFALRDDQPVVIFAGRFGQQHDMKVIQDLAHMMPDWRFWLIGDGKYKPEKWFLPNVQVFRNRDRHGRAILYQTADLLIAPNTNARYPTGLQEAIACGIPVLCSPATAEGSYFAKSHVETETVNPRAPADTAEVWAETLRSKQNKLPRATCKAELANIAQLFWDEDKIASYYADIFQKLCLPVPQRTN